MANEILLDANAILRLLLNDSTEKNKIVKETIEKERCLALMSVIQECVYVLEHYYNVSRGQIKDEFINLKTVVYVENEDIYEKAFDYFVKTPKLDFVDCLLCAYKELINIDVLTFDSKLKKKLESI